MTPAPEASGPLAGVRVIEFTGIGPGPHAAMMLSDLGADVLRIDRVGGGGLPNPVVDRGRAVVEVDIRTDEGRAYCLDAAAHADVLIEGFRPGVMERLGLGPDAMFARNGRLIYGRMTGWGQTGPFAQMAGHDINYIALSGALAAIGKPGEPATPPLNLVGDFGGGSLFLVVGVLSALLERERSGKGQVVDAAIVDGTASLMTMFAGGMATGRFSLEREHNVLGGAAPFYRCYICKDGREISVGSLEPRFFAILIETLGVDFPLDRQYREESWPALAAALAERFASEDRDHWAALFEGTDACVAPVLELAEAAAHPHTKARAGYLSEEPLAMAPAPRFSRTPGQAREAMDASEMLARWRRGRVDRLARAS